MSRSLNYKLSREDRKRGNLQAVGYFDTSGRQILLLTVRGDGPHVRLTCDPAKVSGADKERAADWLKVHFPKLSHDERWNMLFPRASA